MPAFDDLKYSISFNKCACIYSISGVTVKKHYCFKFILLVGNSLSWHPSHQEPYDIVYCWSLSREQKCKFCVDLLRLFLTDNSSNREYFCLRDTWSLVKNTFKTPEAPDCCCTVSWQNFKLLIVFFTTCRGWNLHHAFHETLAGSAGLKIEFP